MPISLSSDGSGGAADGFRSPFARELGVAALIALEALDNLLADQAQPSGPGPSTQPSGISVTDVLLVNAALFESGAYDAASNGPAFLASFVGAIQAVGQPQGGPPDLAYIRAVADAAMVTYSDQAGDGVADLPLLTDAVVEAILAYVLSHAGQGQGQPSV